MILLCFTSFVAYAQVDIRLLAPAHRFEDYRLVDSTDKNFVDIGHQEDMGAWYGHYYRLKDSLPDGEYRIFVDDTLRLHAFMKNARKDSVWTEYYASGSLYSRIPYKEGRSNGVVMYYYENEIVYSYAFFVDGEIQDVKLRYRTACCYRVF